MMKPALSYRARAEQARDAITAFLADLIRIPSPSRHEEDVARRIVSEMEKLEYDDVHIDEVGNVLGQVGTGARRVLVDAHMDTVAVAGESEWSHDPFDSQVRGDVIQGLGACDNKGGVAAGVYGASLISREELDAAGATLFVSCTAMEEECDGAAFEHLLNTLEHVDAVVLGEPTNLRIHRGQRGRVEIKIRFSGVPAHASMPERGRNPIVDAAAAIADIDGLAARLARQDGQGSEAAVLGPGTVAVTKIECDTASLNAIPASCTLYLDRRLTVGEDYETAVRTIADLQGARLADVEIMEYRAHAYTGHLVTQPKEFPAWLYPEDHPLVQASLEAARGIGITAATGVWRFSTNGVASAGRLGIPTVGFGPGDERMAHSTDEECPIAQVVLCAAFYASLPQTLAARS